MRRRYVLALSVYALPLAIVFSLALLGVIFSKRAYVIFAMAHLFIVAGVLWLILKDMEKKINEAIGRKKGSAAMSTGAGDGFADHTGKEDTHG